jgi:hypothetical protein
VNTVTVPWLSELLASEDVSYSMELGIWYNQSVEDVVELFSETSNNLTGMGKCPS